MENWTNGDLALVRCKPYERSTCRSAPKKLTHPSPQHHPQPYRRRPPTIRLRRTLHQKHPRRLPHRRRPNHAGPAQEQQQNHSNPPAKWPQHRKAILAPASQHPHSLRYLHDRQRGTLTGPHRPRRRRQASHRRVSHFEHQPCCTGTSGGGVRGVVWERREDELSVLA